MSIYGADLSIAQWEKVVESEEMSGVKWKTSFRSARIAGSNFIENHHKKDNKPSRELRSIERRPVESKH